MSARPDSQSGSRPEDHEDALEDPVGPVPAGRGLGRPRASEPRGGAGEEGLPTGVAGMPDEPEAVILTDVASLAAERDEYLAALQRMKADFDNYRKRVVRQQEEQSARAAAGLVTKILPVLDNLDLALAHLGDGASEEARALTQARTQLLDVLVREGLERIDAVGVGFDPTVHDAVARSTPGAPGPAAAGTTGADGGEGRADEVPEATAQGADGPAAASHGASVEEVLRAGYRWRGHVLRPAMVKVRG
jgi:molecular chaperone GrpE